MSLFGPRTDVLVFGVPALVAMIVVPGLWLVGGEDLATPPWAFLLLVVGVDVAHVWATLWRVYLDEVERHRRGALYFGTPAALFGAGAMLHLLEPAWFWRTLAYVAVFHFVRQQYGWMMWARRSAGLGKGWALRLSQGSIYISTLAPLVWWHSHTPPFHWFVEGDFVLGWPAWLGEWALGLEAVLLFLYVIHAVWRPAEHGWTGHLVLGSTAATWFLAVVVSQGDFCFTLCNVLPHGIPYMVLCHRYARGRAPRDPSRSARLMRLGAVGFAAALVVISYAEEALWDWGVWHDHPSLFGDPGLVLSQGALAVVVALLATPQVTHYVLDGFIWKVGERNPTLQPALMAPN